MLYERWPVATAWTTQEVIAMERIYLQSALPFLPTCLIVAASHTAFLDSPAPAGNSRRISPRASRRCLSTRKEKKKAKEGVNHRSRRCPSKMNGIFYLMINVRSLNRSVVLCLTRCRLLRFRPRFVFGARERYTKRTILLKYISKNLA